MNYDDLTDELGQLYRDLRTGKVDPAVAHELNATAQNIHAVVRLGLLNAKLKNASPDLKFFRSARKAATKKPAARKTQQS
ncbi:hypothetical protein [Comamonas antarctica]|uniref:hypothetical protein n=1 Tax=Comamonas antarctica TaxID=2743470 RepID=UPI0028EBDAAE|nr:hypothetical protein [Comamonas antarctica]